MSNCIECCNPKEAHAEDGACPWKYKTTFATMDLPQGYTCSDCVNFRFCSQFLGPGFDGTNTTCDWFPIRFQLKLPERPSKNL